MPVYALRPTWYTRVVQLHDVACGVANMVTQTEVGYRVEFEQYDSPLLTGIHRGFFHLISGLWFPMMRFPFNKTGLERYVAMRRLFELSSQYLDEMHRCTTGDAYFAGGVVGCAVVESILMLACVRDRDLVVQTKAWRTYAQKNRKRGLLLSDLLFWMDLGNLIAIGKELGWFAVSEEVTTDFFKGLLSTEELSEISRELPEVYMSPLNAVTRVHLLRNQLHPGKCLRENIHLTDKNAKLTVGLVYVSLMGVMNFYRGDPVQFLELEVPEQVRKLLDWPIPDLPVQMLDEAP